MIDGKSIGIFGIFEPERVEDRCAVYAGLMEGSI